MDSNSYDIIICGTGLQTSLLLLLLIESKKVSTDKILTIDINPYYGGQGPCLNLSQLWNHFKIEGTIPPELGKSRDWNIDIEPKLILGSKQETGLLSDTQIERYMDFKIIKENYVAVKQKTEAQAHPYDLCSLQTLNEEQLTNFLQFVQKVDFSSDIHTVGDQDLTTCQFRQVAQYFNLSDELITSFIRPIVQYEDNKFMDEPAVDIIKLIQYYHEAISANGAPYIFPVYGLSSIVEGASRISAINGGLFMLSQSFQSFLFDNSGKVCGVKTKSDSFSCKQVICEPSYALSLRNKVKSIGKIVRCICIVKDEQLTSKTIFIPSSQSNRQSDIYITYLSDDHKVSFPGFTVVHIATKVETSNPENEIECALNCLSGEIVQKIVWVCEQYEAAETQPKDNIFVTSSSSASNLLKHEVQRVLATYQVITGSEYSGYK